MPHDSENDEDIVRHITGVQQGLFAYIVTLVPNLADADEILQETNIVLWRKRDQFEVGTNFWGWASRIAHLQTLAMLKKRGRERLAFDNDVAKLLASEATQEHQHQALKLSALSTCLAKQSETNRQLIHLCYCECLAADEIGKRVGRSRSAIYDALYRIRLALAECIRRTLANSGIAT